MKIKIINPDSDMTREQMDKREKILKTVSREDTVISMDCPKNNNICIDSITDINIASPEIIKMAKKAEEEGYDVVCIYCLSDPAITACRELLTIPVIGGGQSAFQIACGLGYSFSLITTSDSRIPEKKEFIRSTGVDYTRLCSIRSINFSLSSIHKDENILKLALLETAKKCVDDGAEIIILGCLSFLGMGEEISKEIGIPVIDPALNLINMAELLYNQKLSHSKRSYPYPPKYKRVWGSGEID